MNKITLEIITKIISLQNKQIKGLRKEINTLREEIKSKENLKLDTRILFSNSI